MFKNKYLFIGTLLLAVISTGCLGVFGLNDIEDEVEIETLLTDLENENLDTMTLMGNQDLDLINELDIALKYFTDPFVVSASFELITPEFNDSDDEQSGEDFDDEISITLAHEVLLAYETGWDFQDYLNNLDASIEDLDESLLGIFLAFVDSSFEQILLEDLETDLGEDYENGDITISDPIIAVNGNSATWSKTYSIDFTFIGENDPELTEKISIIFEVNFTKNSSWLINQLNLNTVVEVI